MGQCLEIKQYGLCEEASGIGAFKAQRPTARPDIGCVLFGRFISPPAADIELRCVSVFHDIYIVGASHGHGPISNADSDDTGRPE
jgi:hypothetical protein